MTNYLIQNIPEDKAKEFKTACAHFRQSMRQTILDLMEITILAYQVETGKKYLMSKPKKKKGGK